MVLESLLEEVTAAQELRCKAQERKSRSLFWGERGLFVGCFWDFVGLVSWFLKGFLGFRFSCFFPVLLIESRVFLRFHSQHHL